MAHLPSGLGGELRARHLEQLLELAVAEVRLKLALIEASRRAAVVTTQLRVGVHAT